MFFERGDETRTARPLSLLLGGSDATVEICWFKHC